MNIPIYAAITGVVNTVLQLVVTFGVNITPSQNAAITGLVNALLGLGGVLAHFWIKSNGTSTPPKPGP